jgi:hypothetical protein
MPPQHASGDTASMLDDDGFGSIRLPMPLCHKIDELVARDPTFRSRSDWVKHLVMLKLGV